MLCSGSWRVFQLLPLYLRHEKNANPRGKGTPLELCLQCRTFNKATPPRMANAGRLVSFQLCVLAIVWIGWSVPALLIWLRSAANTYNSVVHGFGGSMEALGGRDGGRFRGQDAWLLAVAGNGSKSGASGPLFHCSRVCTQDLPPSPALISEHRPSSDITIPRPWLFPRLPSSSVLRSPTSSLSGGIIPDGPNRLLYPSLRSFIALRTAASALLGSPGRAATARLTVPDSHRPPPPGRLQQHLTQPPRHSPFRTSRACR
jgi:hypothetical protein